MHKHPLHFINALAIKSVKITDFSFLFLTIKNMWKFLRKL